MTHLNVVDYDIAMKIKRLTELVEEWHLTHKKWILRAVSDMVLGEAEGFNKNYQKHIILRLLQGDRVTPELQIESLIHLADWKRGASPLTKTKEAKKSRRWRIHFPHFVLVGKGSRARTVLHTTWIKKKAKANVK